MELDVFEAVRGNLGDELLAKLLGRSVSSVRLYAKGRRRVPDMIARRLEWLHRISFDLAGGYKPTGIQAWFERPRTQIGWRSPSHILRLDWQPADPDVEAVAALAARLRGPR